MKPLPRITERELDIVEGIYRHRVLTTHQIERRFFRAQSQGARLARRVCKRLVDRGFLARDCLPTKPGENHPYLHYIWHAGVEALKRYRGYEEILWRPDHNDLQPAFTPHRLEVADVVVSMEIQAIDHGLEILRWWNEDHFRRENLRIAVRHNGRQRHVLFHPDGLGIISDGKKVYHVALEVDRGTEASRVFAQKVVTYLHYVHSGHHRQRMGTDDLRVLTVAPSTQRVQNLRRVTAAAGGTDRFLFAERAEVLHASPLIDDIWQPAHSDDRVAVIPVEEKGTPKGAP